MNHLSTTCDKTSSTEVPANSDSETNDASESASNPQNDFDEFCKFAFPEDKNIDNDTCTSDPFYFESDHVALKGNDDYRRLLRAFVSLSSQRVAAIHDLDTLLEMQRNALGDPLQFAEKLQNGKGTEFPGPRHVTELPTIAWDRYTDDVEAVLGSLGGAAHSTRLKQKRDIMCGIRNSTKTSILSNSSSTSSVNGIGSSALPVHGKELNPKPRPATFNQPWSVEEQRHLEHLLRKYPPERFESRRFAKVAAELPGRTLQQVTSRVQKYFIKLAKAGLPVPGRMPNLAAYGGRWSGGVYHGHQRNNHFLYPQSTFLTSYAPPVYMSDDDDKQDDFETIAGPTVGFPNEITPCNNDSIPSSDEEEATSIPTYLHDTVEYRELELLSSLRRERLKQTQTFGNSLDQSSSSSPVVNHVPVTCDEKLEQDVKNWVSKHGSHIDPDYISESTGVSSYLDPNFMPVT